MVNSSTATREKMTWNHSEPINYISNQVQINFQSNNMCSNQRIIIYTQTKITKTTKPLKKSIKKFKNQSKTSSNHKKTYLEIAQAPF
jgi:hypothetical protein